MGRRRVILFLVIYTCIVGTLYISERKSRKSKSILLGISNYFNDKNHHPGICSKEKAVYAEKNKRNWKRIVIWTHYFRRANMWEKVFERHCLKKCEETRCIFTTDRRRVRKADAVLFDGNTLDRTSYKQWEEKFIYPPARDPNQIYIFFTTEPPTRFDDIKLEYYANFFNWTMTYRRDSDVVVPYGKWIKRKKKSKVNYLTQRELDEKKIAIWLNSHCMNSPRVRFMNDLNKFLNIDMFGRCFNRKCGQRATVGLVSSIGEDPCEKSFANYTFFMALENSLCKDYVTEKLYRSLKLGIIPVVYGAVNYSQFAPPNSFIDAKDFPHPKDLALHMQKVANNVTLYNQYLKWKEDYDIDVGTPYSPLICDLCKKLHSSSSKRSSKSYSDISEWFIEKSNCVNNLNKVTERTTMF